MSQHSKHYPQPTQEELDSTYRYTKSFSPFWWEIVQGFIGTFQNPSMWETFTEDIELQVMDLTDPDTQG